MQQPSDKSLAGWVDFFSRTELPVLKQTARDLSAVREDVNKLSARAVAQIIAVDPMLTVKVLRYLQQHKHRSQVHEVVQVEQVLIMMGVDAFFEKIPPQPLVQELMQGQTEALVHLLRVIHRAHRASNYAFDWAVRLSDLRYEEVRIAALLHDLAEMLMWCYAPQEMLKICVMQAHDKTLRTRTAQESVFGFSLFELQHELVKAWELPQLLLTLMDDNSANHPRVRNVVLAVNLARHSANGWDDAALPDDYKDIAELLRMTAEQVELMIGVDAGILCDPNKPHPSAAAE